MSETVRIDLSRADAEWLRGYFRNAWVRHPQDERVVAVLESALAAAPDAPGEGVDSLEALIAECEARRWGWSIECVLSDPRVYEATVLPGDLRRRRATDSIPVWALQSAMQAAGAGEETT